MIWASQTHPEDVLDSFENAWAPAETFLACLSELLTGNVCF